MISYRKATLADIPDLVRLRIDFLKEIEHVEEEGDEISEALEKYFKEHLHKGDYVNWLALDDDKIVSTAGIYFYTIAPNFVNITGNRAYILNVYTIPSFRRQGISRQLFEKLMQEAHDKAISQISLHASAEGKSLYEQFGFRQKANEMVWGKHIWYNL